MDARRELVAQAERYEHLSQLGPNRWTHAQRRELFGLAHWFGRYLRGFPEGTEGPEANAAEVRARNNHVVVGLRSGRALVIHDAGVQLAAPIRFLTNAEMGLATAEALVERQAADPALWVKAGTIGEQRLQRELAELHRVVRLALGVALGDKAAKVPPAEMPGHG